MTASLVGVPPLQTVDGQKAPWFRKYLRILGYFLGGITNHLTWLHELPVSTAVSREAHLAAAQDYDDLNRRLRALDQEHIKAVRWLQTMV